MKDYARVTCPRCGESNDVPVVILRVMVSDIGITVQFDDQWYKHECKSK